MIRKNILFIGPSPSLKNKDLNIPFSGTRSAKILMEWINEMNLFQHKLYFYNISSLPGRTKFNMVEKENLYYTLGRHMNRGFDFKIIALGNIVEKELTLHSKVDNFKLPHPSGLNRKLNDKEFIKEQLKLCKNYLEE